MIAAEVRTARVVSFRPWHYWLGTGAWLAHFAYPILPGWMIARTFDELESRGATATVFVLLAGILAAEAANSIVLWIGHSAYMKGFTAAQALLRANALNGQLASGGHQAGKRSFAVGDTLARLRDDPHDFLMLVDNWIDFFGSLIYGAVAIYFLARVDGWAALAGVAPLVTVSALNSVVGHRARRYRQHARATTSSVSGFLAATFDASLTIKVSGARRAIVRRLTELNARRGRAMVNDQVWADVLWTMNEALSTIAVGVALLVAARRPLTAGEITLFVTYLITLIYLPQRFGQIVVGRRRSAVSESRLDALVGPRTHTDSLLAHRALPVLGGPPAVQPRIDDRVALERLDVRHLTVAERNVFDVSFTITPGTLTVIAGPVGSGKTSLVRALLGLLAADGGEVAWNGVVIDGASFFVPPQCAYVPQVPRLFAEPLGDNIALGHAVDPSAIASAIELAVFEDDLVGLPNGMATLLGTRGVRLSGGQSQRVAAARAFVHRPELLVLDDLTSALDIETEAALWARLRHDHMTVLAVSNRPAALAAADQVIRLSARG